MKTNTIFLFKLIALVFFCLSTIEASAVNSSAQRRAKVDLKKEKTQKKNKPDNKEEVTTAASLALGFGVLAVVAIGLLTLFNLWIYSLTGLVFSLLAITFGVIGIKKKKSKKVKSKKRSKWGLLLGLAAIISMASFIYLQLRCGF